MSTKPTGAQDLTLLEKVDEEHLVQNLKLRFSGGHIYTSIGAVILSVNPYKKLDIYDNKIVQQYRKQHTYELPPHIYSVADEAYESMRRANQDQCVIISGESGAGKTESSKIIMKYISIVSKNSKQVEAINEQLLNSNPCLEALGNAKTNRNDNSSRFGKYMDLQFDYKGEPVGGQIMTYLLEKSRVVQQAPGERSFHIYYQLIKTPDEKLRSRLHLSKKPTDYNYLKGGNCETVNGVDDAQEFTTTQKALNAIGISKSDQDILFETVAAILHLGNIQFQATNAESCTVSKESQQALQFAAELLGVGKDSFGDTLTHRTVKDLRKTGASDVKVPLNSTQALQSRDAIAKCLYDRLFKWMVSSINGKIYNQSREKSTMIGVLDIYGFEIFTKNGFEQFCINYCNEKLQQLFIELTLKSEQEEYAREGIPWTNVEYFNNNIICDLIDAKNKGIYALLDEECLRPGDVTDQTFLKKMDTQIISHKHYESREKLKSDKTLDPSSFRLRHYAGNVTYAVEGFLEKNIDTVNRDVLYLFHDSKKKQITEIFPETPTKAELKRPETSGTQFKASIQQLVQNLLKKQPHYVRCIKPNGQKQPSVFEEELVKHQCRYLGLLENVRVRRAGYCFRLDCAQFLQNYKSLSKHTWPNWKGSIKDGVTKIAQELKWTKDEYAIGNSKIFIRNPASVSQLVEKYEEAKEKIVVKIQRRWKTFLAHKQYKETRENIIRVQSLWRMQRGKKLAAAKKKQMKVKKFSREFYDKKKTFKKSFEREYAWHYLDLYRDPVKSQKWKEINSAREQVVFCDSFQKLHRSNPQKEVPEDIVLTDKNLYIIDAKLFQLKERVPLENIRGVSMSTLADNFIVLHLENTPKLDYLFRATDNAMEFACNIVLAVRTINPKKSLTCSCSNNITAQFKSGQQKINFLDGAKPAIQRKGSEIQITISK